jgi:hypothetical protein
MDVGDLHGLPLDRFVPERDALARALRAQGRREEAAEVASLRKPSVAAWAVNQLVRTQHRAVVRLFEAGQALREAQADVLAGRGEGRALRAAAEREREAVDALCSAARGLLTSQGHELSAAVIERVAETLHAAALDDDAQLLVRGGRLERELRHVGFGPLAAAGIAPARPATRRKSSTRQREVQKRSQRERAASQRAAAQRSQRDRAAAQRSERERAAARKAAQAAEGQARRVADRATRALRAAEERHERALKALGDAEQTLAAAREQADAANDAHRRAKDELDSA